MSDPITSTAAASAGARVRLARALADAAAAPLRDQWSAESSAGRRGWPAPTGLPESPPVPPESAPPPDDSPAAAPASHPAGVVARVGAAAFDPGRPGVRVLAVVAAVVVAGAAALAWWSRPQPEPVAPPLPGTTTGPVAAVTAPGDPPGPAQPTELVVAVTGKVHEPGLVRLPPGSRVADALDAAGGPVPGADLDYLNLARTVTDGELIAVGIPPPPPPVGGPAGVGARPGKVNLNTAGQAELETLPGVGPALAGRILDYRATHGPFEAVTQLRQVSGIGDVRFAELRDRVTV